MQFNKEIDKALKEYLEYEEAESFDDADRSLEKAKSLAIIALAKKFLKDDEDEKEEVVEEKPVEAKAKARAKEELKLTPVTDFEPVLVEVPKDDEPVEVPKPKTEEELTDQWTAYSMQLLAEEMAKIQAYSEEIGEETLVEVANEITNGQVKEMGDITPLNIKLVLASLDKMKEEAEQG